jgi:hypothetical protein
VSSASAVGQDQAVPGMMPAQQRLGADHRPRREIDLRLVVELELLARQGLVQILLERLALAQLAVHRALEEAERLHALALGPDERQTGLLEQLLRIARTGRADRDADARPHMRRLAEQIERLLHQREQALAQPRRARRRLEVGLDDRELVRPHARQRVGLAQAGEQPRAHVAQQQIAAGIAERLVDRLEVGEIEAQHRRDPVTAPAAAQRRAEPLEEHAAIGQTGQRVVAHQVVNLLLGGAQGILLTVRRPARQAAEPDAERGARAGDDHEQPGEQRERRAEPVREADMQAEQETQRRDRQADPELNHTGRDEHVRAPYAGSGGATAARHVRPFRLMNC